MKQDGLKGQLEDSSMTNQGFIPSRYNSINPIFAKTNEPLKLTNSALATSFLNVYGSSSEEEDEFEEESSTEIPPLQSAVCR